MNILFSLKLTAAGRKAGTLDERLAATGGNTIHVLHIRNWRTRHFRTWHKDYFPSDIAKPESMSIHDEEWLCTSPDKGQNHIFSLNCEDLGNLKTAIDEGLYKVT